MAPLLPVLLTFALSFTTGTAFAWNDDYNNPGGYYGGSSTPSYGSPSYDSGFEAMQRTWQREAAEAEVRNQAATEQRNQPPTYSGPSWVNPTPSFGVYGPGNSMQVCQQAGNNVYCF